MKLIIIYFVCIALAYGRQTQDAPCHRSDPYVEQCISDKIATIKPSPRRAPFEIDRINAETSMDGDEMKATLRNIKIYLGSDIKIENLNVNLYNKRQYTGEVHVILPDLYATADYHFRGMKMIFFKFSTHGKFQAKFNNVTVVFNCVALPYLRNGVEYLRLKSVNAKISIGASALDFKAADRTWAGRQLASFARSDPTGAMEKLIPGMEDNMARFLKDYVNDVLAKVPLNAMLVD